MSDQCSESVFRHQFAVPVDSVDQNGHVNNVVYVQWMQDVAMLHSEATGGTRAMCTAGASWVVRSHRVEYLAPAFAGEVVVALTWVADIQRVTSMRRYRFVRKSDRRLLVRGETQWVFVDANSGRPRRIPDEVRGAFTVVPEVEESKQSERVPDSSHGAESPSPR